MAATRKHIRRRPRAKATRADVASADTGISYGTEIGAVVAIGIVAALGIVLWRGRDSLPALPTLPSLPAPDDVRASWKSAMKRLPHVDPEKLSDVSRGFDALRHIFSRA
jgi:hypothetical protein